MIQNSSLTLYMINIIWHGSFRITCRIYPLPISSLELKFSRWYLCLGLIQDVIRGKNKKNKENVIPVLCQTDLHSYSKQPTAHSFIQSKFLVGKFMFSLSLLCKKNASHIQNYPCKYSLNWKSFRHKEMEFLPFLVVTTNVWYSILNLLLYFIQGNFNVR